LVPEAVDKLIEMNILSYVSVSEVGVHAKSIAIAYCRGGPEFEIAEKSAKADREVFAQ
jgi:hypothetical protein